MLTGGGHPFGRETHKREANIMEHDADLSELQGPEAAEAQVLIASMISAQPERRISALQVLAMSFQLTTGAYADEFLPGLSSPIFLGSAPSPAVCTFVVRLFRAVCCSRASRHHRP